MQDKSRLAIIRDYFTGGSGGEYDTYRDPELYDKGAQSPLYRRDNLARGIADVLEAVSPPASATGVLELGAGTGILTVELAGRGYNVTALDLFAQPLVALNRKQATNAYHGRILPVQADMNRQLPFARETFDTVVTLRANRYIKSAPDWLQEARHTLKPGGTLIMPVFLIDMVPWKRHSVEGMRQPTGTKAIRRLMSAAGFNIDTAASGKYTARASMDEGRRSVPPYYRPTVLVAQKC